MPEVQLNGETILIALAVVLIFLESISIISKGIDAWKKITGRDSRAAEMMTVNRRIGDLERWKTNVDLRLQQGDVKFNDINRDTTEILIVLHTIIKHMQSGNDHQKLQETDDKLYKYLVEKRGVTPSTLS